MEQGHSSDCPALDFDGSNILCKCGWSWPKFRCAECGEALPDNTDMLCAKCSYQAGSE